jgi:hypothetical protein
MGLGETDQTTDSIVIMQQILEKCYVYNTEMHVLFIDFKQALALLTGKNHTDNTGIVCLFVFLALQPTVVVFFTAQ